jgi:hypothetical protein
VTPTEPPLTGSVRWGVVPFSPRPPFRIYTGPSQKPIVVDRAETLIETARKGDAELTYLVPAKVRPVLVLAEPPGALHNEVIALRLLRLAKLPPTEQDEVRANRHRLLFHLSPGRFRLPEENAAMVNALVRVDAGALSSDFVGTLTVPEMSVLSDRIIRYYGFDTRLAVERKLHELAARQGA